jgi:fatty acid desaturase
MSAFAMRTLTARPTAARANGARATTTRQRVAQTPRAIARAGALSANATRDVNRGANACANKAIAIDGAASGSDSLATMTTMTYNETGKWRENLDLAGWAAEMRAIEKEFKAPEHFEEDVKHLKKILTWANLCYFGGLAALTAMPMVGLNMPAWLNGMNPIAAFMMSTAICARWTMVGHHTCHGGYNAAQSTNGEVTGRFHRRKFARGLWRRCTDWMDWMLPEAWDVEHNHLHHYQLGEDADPDLVERNMQELREGNTPMVSRYLQVAGLALVWKWFYYAPNTLKELLARKEREAAKAGNSKPNPFKTGSLPSTVLTVAQGAFKGEFAAVSETIKCFAPYALWSFAALPAIGYAIGGPKAALAWFMTSVLADVMTNVHSFIIIATNHVGDDIYRFETETKPRSDDFYLRAVIGSANFKTGGDANDFMHGWLNYQIEHHMFPDMSMRAYQNMQPRVKAVCEKYGVPYVQESVFTRLGQLVDVMVGKRTMLVWENGD